MMQPDISIPVGHCLVALNNHEEEFCVECKSGYTFINDVCTATGLEINNDLSVFIVKPFTEGNILSGEQTFSANDKFILETMTVNLGFYFRFNFSEKNEKHNILKIGSITASAVFADYHPYIQINIQGKDLLLGPIEADKMFNWMSFNLSYGMTQIYANVRYTGVTLSTIGHQFKHTTTAMLDLPEEYTILDGHHLVDIYGLHVTDKNYGLPMIPEPFIFDCGIDCLNCAYKKCTIGKYGIDEETLTTKFREISIPKQVGTYIPVLSIGEGKEFTLLRSRNYSFWFVYHTTSSDREKLASLPNPKVWMNVLTVVLGDSTDESHEANNIKIEHNIMDARKFRISYETQWTNTHLSEFPSHEFELPNMFVNSIVQVFLSVNKGKISALLYDTALNYEIAMIDVQGGLDFLNSSSNIKFGQMIDTKLYQDFSHISASIDYNIPMTTALSYASKISYKAKKQIACDQVDELGVCIKCKDGYQVVSDKNGLKSCAFTGSVIANQTGQIRYTTNSHPIIYDYDVTEHGVDNINFMINIQIPQGTSNPLGLIRLSDIDVNNNRTTLVSLFVKDDNLFCIDRMDQRALNAIDVLKGEDRSSYLTVSLRYDNKIGFFKLQTYSSSTGLVHSSEAIGDVTGIEINKVQIQIGFEEKQLNSQKEFKFKASSAYLYVNTDDNKSADIKKVTYILDSCNTPCKNNCSNNVCTNKFTVPFEIPATVNTSPLALSTIDNTFVSDEEFYEYFVKVAFQRKDNNANLKFLLSNNATLKTQSLPLNDIVLAGIDKSKSSISIHSGNDLTGSFFGINGLVSLIPSGYTADQFTNFDIQMRFNSRNSVINISLGADDLVFVHTLSFGSSNWDIQAINNDSMVVKGEDVEAFMSFVNVIEFGKHDVVNGVTKHGITNCKQTLIGDEEITCIKCNEGFNNNFKHTECIPNDNTQKIE